MSNSEEKHVKELKKDYGAVKEKEHETKKNMKENKAAYQEKVDKTDKDYESAIDSLDSELEKIKELYIQKQESEKKKYVEKVGRIKQQLDLLKEKHEVNVKQINDVYLKRQKEIKKTEKELEKEKDTKLNQEKESMSEQSELFTASRQNIEKTYQEAKEKQEKEKEKVKEDFDQQLQDVRTSYDEHLHTLEESTKEQIKDLEHKIALEKSAKEEKIQIIKGEFEDQIALIEEKRQKTDQDYDIQMKSLDESVEHKVARHEKFMEKSEKDNDERAVKLHRNEIKNLRKLYDKDLNDLQKNKQTALSKLDQELADLKKHFTSEKFMVEKSYIEAVEELNYQIELRKAEEKYKEEKSTLTLDVDIMSVGYEREQAKFALEKNELVIDENKDGSLNKHQVDKEIIQSKHEQNMQLILREFDGKEAQNTFEEDCALIEKEADISILNLDASIDEASGLFDLETEKRRQALQKELLCYEEQIAHYENDYERQNALKNEYVSYQTMVKSLEQNQLKEMAEYDEAETKNRYQLKISYLESLLPMIEQDKDMLLEKIDQQFSLEGVMYDEQIDLISKARLEEMEEIKKDFDLRIEKMKEKRDQLDPNGYKREIKEYSSQMKDLEHEKEKMIDLKKKELRSKTALYKDAKEETEARKNNAFKEAIAFFDKEKDHIKRTVQMLKEELDKELYNKDSYLQKMKDDALHYEAFTKELANLMDEQNSAYLQRRIDKAKEHMQELRDAFEEEVKERKLDLKEQTDKYEDLKREVLRNKEEKIASAKEKRDQKIQVINEQAGKTKARFESLKKEKEDKLDSKLKEMHHMVKQKIHSLEQDLEAEKIRLKNTKKDVDKSVKALDKQFAKTKKLIYKKYQASLKKELDSMTR